jgi:hypothetical protein
MKMARPGGGDQLAADDQQAVLQARHEALDQHAAAFFQRDLVGGFDFFLGVQVDEHAAAMVAVAGLDHHRQADVLGGLPGVFGLSTRRPSGTGTPQVSSSDLVRSLSREMPSAMALVWSVRRSRCGATCAVAQLHQVAVGQADGGDAALVGGIHDAGGAGPRHRRSTMRRSLATVPSRS